jgi:hypothetical protein
LTAVTTPDATNDDLVEFLAKKRKTETYRGAQDGEIVAREKSKLSYWLAIYGAAACATAYAAGLMQVRGLSLSLGIPAVCAGGFWLLRRYRRLDDFAALLMSRERK